MFKLIATMLIFFNSSTAVKASFHDPIIFENNLVQQDNLKASLNVFSRKEALAMWELKDQSRFLSKREIRLIAFVALEKSDAQNLPNSKEISRAVKSLIESYQSNDFELWRSNIGRFYLLNPDNFDHQGFVGAIQDFLGAIDFGDLANVIQQIVQIIQIFF
ncbi:hypothetical protein CMK18_22635 [Candidatus Poribacteria bacterium]|nr:hypothetical protein [Candidatus Poribacteria bacterium]